MPTLDEFKEKQKKIESKRKEVGFKPKRYAPYLLQEEVVNVSESNRNIVNINAYEDYKENSKDLLQKQNKPIEELISGLYGIKKKIIFYFLDLCEERGDLTTGPVTSEVLIKISGSTYKTIKRILQNMIEDGLIKRKNGKRGRGGFSIFILSHKLKEEILKYKQIIKHVKQDFKDIVINSNSQSNTVNIEPLLKIGLTEQHLNQISNYGKLSLEMIQDSIDHFAFDLANNDKAKTLKKSPLDFFMGILRQGCPYAAPGNYQSPEAESMKLYLESKNKLEYTKKKLEEELKASMWKEWEESLSEQDLFEFYVIGEELDGVPEKIKATLKRRNALTNAKQYFEVNIWPEERRKMLEKKKNI